MKIDLSRCEIRTPDGDERLPLYRMLKEIFPSDGPLIGELIEEGERFPSWPAHALYSGNEVLGNVSLAPIQVRLDGRSTNLVGIAWVATREEYRRQGIARHLLRHVIEVVDEQGLPSVLFTGLPGVYEPLGYVAVRQVYPAVPARQLAGYPARFDGPIHQTLTASLVETMAKIYSEEDPNRDGRIVRDAKYWQLYRAFFNANPGAGILFGGRPDRAAGYVRIETEDDRLLVSELCCPPAASDVARALLGCVAELATDGKRDTITLALPPENLAMQILQRSGAALEPEPAGAGREIFMVRPPGNRALGALETLQWPLCDKF